MGGLGGVALYLAGVQLLFALGWVVYALFLPQLVVEAGLGPRLAMQLLLVDQLIFVVMDPVLGLAADRVGRLTGRIGGLVVVVTALSCLAFLVIPLVGGGGGGAWLVGAIALWAMTSSALRGPLVALIGRRTSVPERPVLSSLLVVGGGVAGLIGPFVASALRGGSSTWPFALSSVTLLLATLGMLWAERRLGPPLSSPRQGGGEANPASLALLLVGVAVAGLGFQLHLALRTVPLWKQFVAAAELDRWLAVFWIGFQLSLFPAAWLGRRRGYALVAAAGALVGALGALVAALAPSLPLLAAAQLVAGAGWGALLATALAAILIATPPGREGFHVGLWHGALALATLARIGVALQGFAVPSWLAPTMWGAGGLALAGAALLSRRRAAGADRRRA